VLHPYSGEAGAIGAALCAGDGKPHGKASGFRGFDTIAALTYTSTTAAETVCKWCPMQLHAHVHRRPAARRQGRAWSKVPLAEGWERVISGNSWSERAGRGRQRDARGEGQSSRRSSVSTLTLPRWFARTRSAESAPAPSRASLRVGVPRVLNLWSTHQFWMACSPPLAWTRATSSSRPTPRRAGPPFGKGAAPWTAAIRSVISGHYGELLFGQKQKLDILFSPMIYTLPTFMSGHVARTLSARASWPAREHQGGFVKERDVFAEAGIALRGPLRLARRATGWAQAALRGEAPTCCPG